MNIGDKFNCRSHKWKFKMNLNLINSTFSASELRYMPEQSSLNRLFHLKHLFFILYTIRLKKDEYGLHSMFKKIASICHTQILKWVGITH